MKSSSSLDVNMGQKIKSVGGHSGVITVVKTLTLPSNGILEHHCFCILPR